MAVSGMIGEVICSADGCFRWTIDDFLSHVWHGEEIRSPVINFAGGRYYLGIYFKIQENNITLDITRERESPSCRVHVKLGMRTGCRGKRTTRWGEVDGDGDCAVGVRMTCSEMLERRSEILPRGRLTTFCELRTLDMDGNTSEPQQKLPSQERSAAENEIKNDSDEEETISRSKRQKKCKDSSYGSDSEEEEMVCNSRNVKKIREDFKSLLLSEEDSDVLIKVQGKKFPAHRCILRSRSPVFKSMFSFDIVEKESGVVVMDDCDPETFPDFLNYIYTGSTDQISVKNVSSLYISSDKYGVNELKYDCALFMKNNLTVEKFCDIITLASRHRET